MLRFYPFPCWRFPKRRVLQDAAAGVTDTPRDFAVIVVRSGGPSGVVAAAPDRRNDGPRPPAAAAGRKVPVGGHGRGQGGDSASEGSFF